MLPFYFIKLTYKIKVFYHIFILRLNERVLIMPILLVNCFHWIGFHIMNELLEAGYMVEGIDNMSTEQDEHLSMFVGRNSSFTLIEKENLSHYKSSIIVGSWPHSEDIQADQMLQLCESNAKNLEEHIIIEMPMLFGEWMPMTEDGLYHQQKFIPFNSSLFLTEAIYIRDFTSHLLQWVTYTNLSQVIKIKSERNKDTDLKLENIIYLRDNRPIHKKVEHVVDHYKRFKDLYES